MIDIIILNTEGIAQLSNCITKVNLNCYCILHSLIHSCSHTTTAHNSSSADLSYRPATYNNPPTNASLSKLPAKSNPIKSKSKTQQTKTQT